MIAKTDDTRNEISKQQLYEYRKNKASKRILPWKPEKQQSTAPTEVDKINQKCRRFNLACCLP